MKPKKGYGVQVEERKKERGGKNDDEIRIDEKRKRDGKKEKYL